MTAPNQHFHDDEDWHELVDTLVLAVRGGQYPSFEFVRAAIDHAEQLSGIDESSDESQ